ncbi:hypothetical protein CONLIGDRAFT_461062 [Coniochaeta ligniaria NRRL 30616]|uniref:Bromo domain-containing protein n=1 Tax=Coniochaeta ligniaria NRRL 30616 TaxID=1408157 RepID=A0A1J7ILB9_9PEZI|nr:hypothetical protein CONLIGDRAFT_461062 [Coniochaeta ligniaria NRRL 30616]
MDNKRKAATANGGGSEADERAAKRRKMPPPPSQFNLLQGETAESTTSYGLSFLDQLRRTQDKSGRLVAGYFEELLPRKGNEDYYAKTPMPVSLRTLEQKLYRREFKNMAEFESWLRRMVKNAKDYYSRHSDVFEDAERIRKAVSNYMTKTNPAYKKIPSYSCQPAPIPETPLPLDEGDGRGDEDVESEQDAEGEGEAEAEDEVKDDEDEGDEEDEDEDEDEDEGDDDGDSDAEARPKRRGPGRPSVRGKVKPDHEYEGVPYKGLTFQQAQEKIVEEMIRKPDDEEPEYGKFEAFLNLPSRSLKEYFSIIQNPLSLKGLQKLVKGIHGRNPPTGVSEFKGWAAFEERTNLLWENAHYFNEEGSDIYNQATELKEFFEAELGKAKAVVQEPPQPKIKLRVPQPQEAPATTGPKKITIHVGGSRAQTTASPAPQSGTPVAATPSDGAMSGIAAQRFAGPNGGSGLPMSLPQLERMRSMSGAVASPSPPIPGVKQELANGQSPAVTPRLSGVPPQPLPFPPPMHMQPQPQFLPPGAPVPVQNGYHHPPVERQQPIYNKIKRAPGRGLSSALIKSLHIRGHPNIPIDNDMRFNIKIPADPVYAQHSITVHVPNNQYKLQVIPIIAPLEQQNRAYRLFVVCNGNVLSRSPPFPIPDDDLAHLQNLLVFEANLGLGLNEIQVHVVAALPKGQKLPGGEECEVEVFRVVAQLMRA